MRSAPSELNETIAPARDRSSGEYASERRWIEAISSARRSSSAHDLLGSILAVLGDERIVPGDELIELRALLFGERHGLRVDAAQGVDEVVRIFRIHRDPLPAFPRYLLAGCLELFEHQAVEELAVGVVAAVVFDEEIAKNDAAGGS